MKAEITSPTLNEMRAKLGLPQLDLPKVEAEEGDGFKRLENGKLVLISGGKIVALQG